ncbi:MAG: methyltransferase domain-containing protein [Phycisphaerae bacterium]|nr:methyltransferase domain-containing protein [Phycisphaerae bacterium]
MTTDASQCSSQRGDWWTTFFDDTYANLGLIARQGADATHIVEVAIRELKLEPGMRVFDQCCGIGRIAIPLAQRGMIVEGVELAASYVERARADAAKLGVSATFVEGDAFRYVASLPCDAAINVFTSFGYAADAARNEEMLRRAFESLKPGGRFLLERFNPCRIVAFGLTPYGSRVPLPECGGDAIILDEPVADWHRGVITSTWTIFFPDGRREVRSFETAMLFPHELIAMARSVGFVDIELRSGNGEPYDRHARRLLLLARRP